MVAHGVLLTGTVIYILLHVLFNLNSNNMTVNEGGKTNLFSTVIFFCGISLFLSRFERTMIPDIFNYYIRTFLQVFGVVITYELLLAVVLGINYIVLEKIPVVLNQVLYEHFDVTYSGHWPFVMLLWLISIFFVQIANNIDRYMAYYLGEVDNSVLSGSDSDVGDEESISNDEDVQERQVENVFRPRSRYTQRESSKKLEPLARQLRPRRSIS